MHEERLQRAAEGDFQREVVAAPVDRRTLGKSGLEVSRLALAGSFGVSREDTVRAFHELGVTTFFVTSGARGLVGGIRQLIAEGHRDALVIVSVVSVPFGFMVRRTARRMLNLLGTDHVDVLLLGWVRAHWYVTGNTWTMMRQLKAEGLTRALGISCHDRPLAKDLASELDLDVLMLRYNAAHRGAEREVFDQLPDVEGERAGVIAYTSTRWGGLLKPAGELGPMTPGECYRFSLGHPKVDTVLCGGRNFDELAQNVRDIARGPLPPDRLAEVKKFGDVVRATMGSKIAFSGG